ncbi:hypothetical protein [Brachybacterium tyrofermentans]|uniref:DUF624 domain-containing protein n=1 Tax=Brachybacterium tyrofermentans TaxID=47848 RepID=A0ABW0FJT9_9MICO
MTPRAPAAPAGPSVLPTDPRGPGVLELTAPQDVDDLSRFERGIGRRDPLEARGLVRFLTKPAAFLGANWAALLGILTVIGIVPALAGATRTTSDLEQYEDAAFTTTLGHVRRTLRRDAPMSILLLLVLGGIGANALVLPSMAPSTRVFAVGLMLPVVWVMVALLSAYVVAAARDQLADRPTVVLRALALVARRPLSALLTPALVVVLSPVWLLAPLTIACGFSVPPWVVGRVWGDSSAGSSV